MRETKQLLNAIARVDPERRHVLPLSVAYRPNEQRPHAITAAHPDGWWQVSRDVRRERGRVCECCGSVEGHPQVDRHTGRPMLNRNGYQALTVIQVAHIHHNPDERDPRFFRVLCSICHREHDKPQQVAAGAITMAIQGNLLPERLRERLHDIRSATEARGVQGLTPAAVDLTILNALVGGPPLTIRELCIAVAQALPGILGDVNGVELAAIVHAGIIRLNLRELPDELPPRLLVRVDGTPARVTTVLTTMTCAPTANGRAPMTRWTSTNWAH